MSSTLINAETVTDTPTQDTQTENPPQEMPQMPEGGMRSGRGMHPPRGGMPPQMNEMPYQNNQSGEDSQDMQMPDFNNEFAPPPNTPNGQGGTDNTPNGAQGSTQNPNAGSNNIRGGMGGFRGGMPNQGFDSTVPVMSNAQEELTPKSFIKEYFTPLLSIVLLALAFVFVIFYKRKNY